MQLVEIHIRLDYTVLEIELPLYLGHDERNVGKTGDQDGMGESPRG